MAADCTPRTNGHLHFFVCGCGRDSNLVPDLHYAVATPDAIPQPGERTPARGPKMKSSLQFVYVCAFSVPCLFSQAGGSQGAGAGSSSRWSSFTAPAAKIVLTGSVKIDDGSPLPGSVSIEVSCGGATYTVAHTNVLDDFGFQASGAGQLTPLAFGNAFSSLSGTNSDAASGIHPGSTSCDLQAELAGFRSSVISLNNPMPFDGANVGVIWLHRVGRAEGGNMVSVTTLEAPKEAKKSFDKGKDLMRAGKLADAAVWLQKAVTIDPRFAEAWVNLGFVQYKRNQSDAAEASVLKARDIDPKLAGIYQILGYIASDRRDWSAAIGYLGEAERLNPLSSALPWYLSAVAYYQLHRFNEAERSIRQEIQIDSAQRFQRARFLLGLILVARNEISTGTQMLRDYLAASPDPEDVKVANSMLSRLEPRAAQ
jgi:tetratricopeptide (TPR) repeat protein